MGSILIDSTLFSSSTDVNQKSMRYAGLGGSVLIALWQIFSNSVICLVLGGHLSKPPSNTVLKSPPHKISAEGNNVSH